MLISIMCWGSRPESPAAATHPNYATVSTITSTVAARDFPKMCFMFHWDRAWESQSLQMRKSKFIIQLSKNWLSIFRQELDLHLLTLIVCRHLSIRVSPSVGMFFIFLSSFFEVEFHSHGYTLTMICFRASRSLPESKSTFLHVYRFCTFSNSWALTTVFNTICLVSFANAGCTTPCPPCVPHRTSLFFPIPFSFTARDNTLFLQHLREHSPRP